MLFNSLGYLLFLIVAFGVTLLTPRRLRYVWWGVMSVLFYSMWRWEFTFLLVLNSVFDYSLSLAIHRLPRSGWRRFCLVLDLLLNFGMLIFFKYSYFLYHQAWRVGQWTGWPALGSPTLPFDIVLPLGISFYTFQTVSYTIDVYRGMTVPVQNFWLYLTYVNFWPQLIAGPILRADEVLRQLRLPRALRSADVAAGLRRVLVGMARKVLLADALAPLVERAFDLAGGAGFTAPDAWVAATLFGFQIYSDFAGYSDIAIGSARMFGVRLPENFNWPYLARSPREFWKGWHISLSSWVRDYLYLPLLGARAESSHSTGGIGIAAAGAARDSGARRTAALFLTWLLMGFWHGAGWTFAFWGLYHAVAIYVFRAVTVLRRLPERSPRLAWAVTLAVAMASWIPFRAQSMSLTVKVLAKLVDPRAYLRIPVLDPGAFVWAGGLVAGMLVLWRIRRLVSARHGVGYAVARVLFYAGLTTALILRLRPVEQFIYFQF